MNDTASPTEQFHAPKTAEEYMEMAERLSGLADLELSAAETDQSPDRLRALAMRLPALVSLVNVIGYLRGQDCMFLRVRPEGMHENERQASLMKNEDAFERRLQRLIDEVGASSEADAYRKTLERYYVTARSVRVQ